MTAAQQWRAALAVEWLKFRCAPVVLTTSVLLLGGILLISMASVLALGGSSTFAAKAATFMTDRGWAGLFDGATQVGAVAGFLAFGLVIGWMFGREFTDGTVTGLYGIPVTRRAIAAAKFTVVTAWIGAMAIALTSAVLAAGWLLGFHGPAGAIAVLAWRLLLVTLLTGLLAFPCACVATAGRGYLAAIGAVTVVVVLSQAAVIVGIGGWFPFAAPGLWAAAGGAPLGALAVVQLLLALPIAALGAALTLRMWRRLTL
ncbi:MAG: ABC transporter permease [Specibacter sp.]